MRGPGSRYTRYSAEYQLLSPLHLPLQSAFHIPNPHSELSPHVCLKKISLFVNSLKNAQFRKMQGTIKRQYLESVGT
jgi:hypothetical protein